MQDLHELYKVVLDGYQNGELEAASNMQANWYVHAFYTGSRPGDFRSFLSILDYGPRTRFTCAIVDDFGVESALSGLYMP